MEASGVTSGHPEHTGPGREPRASSHRVRKNVPFCCCCCYVSQNDLSIISKPTNKSNKNN